VKPRPGLIAGGEPFEHSQPTIERHPAKVVQLNLKDSK
jgi:hypothetical protein